jgi:hypothetical protein
MTDSIVLLRHLVHTLTAREGRTAARTLSARARLAAIFAEHDAHDDAIAALESLVADCADDLGLAHEQTLRATNNLAMRMAEAGRPGAIDLFTELLAHSGAAYGAEHRQTLLLRNNYAATLGMMGKIDDAIAEFEAILPLCEGQCPDAVSGIRQNLRSWRFEQRLRSNGLGWT